MWSDLPSQERLSAIIEKLHVVLPAPSHQRARVTELKAKPTLEQVAALLNAEPGFALVRGGAQTYLLRKPLVTLSFGGSALVSSESGRVEIGERAFAVLEAALAAWRGPAGARLAGFLSYDLASELEELGDLPPDDFHFPGFYFGLFDSALQFDGSSWSLLETDAWRFLEGAADAEDLLARAAKNAPITAGVLTNQPLRSKPDRVAFEQSVERIVASIHAGDIFQTNLCRRIEAELTTGSDWNLFQRMRAVSPAKYEAFFRLSDDRSVLSISPELFLKVDDGIVESRPIKGTRPRGHNAEEDQSLITDLCASEKDRAELAMIVDVVRNDLARVCEAGSVEVSGHAELMSLPTVHHLFSIVTGRLRGDAGLVDLLRAAFPAASITGAPKIEAMKIAMREEHQRRGPCMGAIGWIGMDGSAELSVAIRTAFVTGGIARYYAGCGITADSIAESEFHESRHKAAAFVRGLGREDDPAR